MVAKKDFINSSFHRKLKKKIINLENISFLYVMKIFGQGFQFSNNKECTRITVN